jgi:two-component system, OmpR family, alkaline phosphatase synthesis response regulator PhoP
VAGEGRSRRALVVEDDVDISELIVHYLKQDGWTVEATGDGPDARARLQARAFDLVILDLQLRGGDGLALCAEIRRDDRTKDTPVIMATARAAESDRIVGLEMGADDYVVKPFSPKELLARVRAVVRRSQRGENRSALTLGDLDVDTGSHVARWKGKAVHLTAKEFALLVALLRARGRVLTRQHLLETVWGYSYADGTRTVDVHVRRLREKLPGLGESLVTVKSLGYRIDVEPAG